MGFGALGFSVFLFFPLIPTPSPSHVGPSLLLTLHVKHTCTAYMQHIHVHLPSSPQSVISLLPQQLQTLTVEMKDWICQPSHSSLKEDPGLTSEIPAVIKKNGPKKRTKSG